MIIKCVKKKVIQKAKCSIDLTHIDLMIYNLAKVDTTLSLSKYDSFTKVSDLAAYF